jgi:NADH-quinone oxidoreductase subunit C
MDWLDKAKERLQEALIEEGEFRGEHTWVLGKSSLSDSLVVLKDEFGFNSLVDLCGLDMGEGKSPRFYVVYHLRNMDSKAQIRVKVGLEEGEVLSSSCGLWVGADWMEREVYDMFGMDFEGHPGLARLYLPEDFPGHPLRKDYPTEGYDFEE